MASEPFVGVCPQDGQLDVVHLRLLREVHDERRSVLDLEDFVDELQAIIKSQGIPTKKIIYQPQTLFNLGGRAKVNNISFPLSVLTPNYFRSTSSWVFSVPPYARGE